MSMLATIVTIASLGCGGELDVATQTGSLLYRIAILILRAMHALINSLFLAIVFDGVQV